MGKDELKRLTEDLAQCDAEIDRLKDLLYQAESREYEVSEKLAERDAEIERLEKALRKFYYRQELLDDNPGG